MKLHIVTHKQVEGENVQRVWEVLARKEVCTETHRVTVKLLRLMPENKYLWSIEKSWRPGSIVLDYSEIDSIFEAIDEIRSGLRGVPRDQG